MTFTAGLIATMALPAYAFGGGGNFGTQPSDLAIAGDQTLIVPDASAALAVSRDNYTAPTREEFEASRQAAAAAVAATQAAEVAAAAKATSPAATPFTVNPPSGPYSGDAIVAYAQQFVGVVPYGTGATPDTSFSCDGLTQYVFAAFGIYLPRMVSNQAAMGIPIAPATHRPGISWSARNPYRHLRRKRSKHRLARLGTVRGASPPLGQLLLRADHRLTRGSGLPTDQGLMARKMKPASSMR